MRKSIHGFPLFPYMGMGLLLAALRAPLLKNMLIWKWRSWHFSFCDIFSRSRDIQVSFALCKFRHLRCHKVCKYSAENTESRISLQIMGQCYWDLAGTGVLHQMVHILMLPNFDARQMCVKYVMALPVQLILDKEEVKCGLTLTPPLTHVKGEIKYLRDLPYIWSLSKTKQCQQLWLQLWRVQRRSKALRLCTPLISYVKGVQTGHWHDQNFD